MSKSQRYGADKRKADVEEVPVMKAVAVAVAVVTAPALPPTVKVDNEALSLDMYCALKNIHARRRAGMRAYTKIDIATMSSWDEIFKNY